MVILKENVFIIAIEFKKMKIKSIDVGAILNSINEETVEVTVNNIFKASTGGDGGFNKIIKENPGKDISLEFLNKILNKGLIGYNLETLKDILEIEEILLSYDKTNELSKLGGNVLLSLEFALLKLISNNNPISVLNKSPDKFPLHICNCAITNFNDKKIMHQEIILIPNTKKFSDSLFANFYVYRRLGNILKVNERNDEGAFITNMKNENVFFALEKLTTEVTKKLGIDFSFGLNVNSSGIYSNGFYKSGKESFLVKDHLQDINKLVNRFDITYLEDPLSEENINLSGKLKTDFLCGNRAFGNNLENLKKYAKYFNCAVLKVNELGSLGRLKKIVEFCKNNDISLVMGQTLGDTNETILSDLVVGFEFDFIKSGLYGKERLQKLNEIKRLESEFVI